MSRKPNLPPLFFETNPYAILEKNLIKIFNIDKEQLKQYIIKINNTEDILKFMNKSKILDIYSKIDSIDIKYGPAIDKDGKEIIFDDRQILQIIEPIEKAGQKFYKSKGESRNLSEEHNIKDFWFPFVDINIIGEKRLIKSEDKYLLAIETIKNRHILDLEDPTFAQLKLLLTEILYTDSLLDYGRFIDNFNAAISKRLYELDHKSQAGGKKNIKKSSKKSSKKQNKKSSKKSSKKQNKKSSKKSSKKLSKKTK